MQRAESGQTPKRPRCDSSPRTPPNIHFRAAERSPDPKLPPDCKNWDPEQVCLFLERNGFKDPALLDRFRGSKGWRAEGLRDGDPRR